MFKTKVYDYRILHTYDYSLDAVDVETNDYDLVKTTLTMNGSRKGTNTYLACHIKMCSL